MLFSFQVFAQKEDWLIPYRKDTLWGYCDVNGKIKIKPQFKEAGVFRKKIDEHSEFEEEMAIAFFKEDSCALINMKGQIVSTASSMWDNKFYENVKRKERTEEKWKPLLYPLLVEEKIISFPSILPIRQLTPYIRCHEFNQAVECFLEATYAFILTDNQDNIIIPYTEGQIHVFKDKNCILIKKRGDKILLDDKGKILTHFIGVVGLTKNQCFPFGFMFFNNYPQKAKNCCDYIGFNGVKYFEDTY
jgi:hypothetical protein